MKSQTFKRSLLVGALLAGVGLSGCGGGSSAANTVTVIVTGAASVLVPKQTETLSANVNGATDVSSDFACTYSTTADPTTATPNPTAVDKGACTSAVGTLSNIVNTSTTVASTAVFTAPDTFPDQKTLPHVIVTITATAHADKKKTGKFTIQFDSGVRIFIVPTTVTLATTETKTFNAQDFNGNLIANDLVTWGLTYESTAKIASASCSGGANDCGSLALVNGFEVYTAPAKVPVAAPASTTAPVNAAGIVTIFVFSKIDNARIAQGSITIVTGGTVTFNGLSPLNVPLGGPAADIFLAAPNVTSQVGITLTTPSGATRTINNLGDKIKPVFASGGTTSIGARIRLTPQDLPVPGAYKVQITSGGTLVPGSFTFNVVRVAPSIISTFPDNFQQKTLGSTTSGLPTFNIDGGYFGQTTAPAVGPPLINNNQNQGLLNFTITPRTIFGFLPTLAPPAASAGLFPVSVTNSLGVPPLTAYTNVAIIPDYGGVNAPTDPAGNPSNPTRLAGSGGIFTAPAPLQVGTATSAPSAIAIDPILAMGVITLAGVNDPAGNNTNAQHNVQFFSLTGTNIALGGTATSGGNVATGVAIDDQLHLAAIVNYASRNLALMNIPSGTAPPGCASPCLVDLSAVFQAPNSLPFPYAVGIDPFLHRALVAFASTNVGLIVNIDPTATPTCILAKTSAPFCVTGYVTLNTGAHPQVAFEAGEHIAYVTPGGGGLLEGINLASPPSPPLTIAKVKRTSNSVQVTTTSDHHISSGISALGGPTVLIAGVPTGSAGTTFNGAFPVTSVLGSKDFTFAQALKDDSVDCTNVSPACTATPGVVNLVFQVSSTFQGIAVNPITRRLVFVNPNVTGSQIEFLDPLSQSFTAMSLFHNAVGGTFSGTADLGVAGVAFQPFSNTAVAFNPDSVDPNNPAQHFSQISLIDPSLLQRAAIINTGHPGTATVTFPTVNPTVTLPIPGAIAVDPVSNIAIAANSGDSTLTVIGLGQIKSVHIEELRTPAIPGTTLRHAVITPVTAAGAAPVDVNVQIFGSGFDGTSRVRLDGTPLAAVSPVNSHEIDITIPKSFLGAPHRFALDVVTGNIFSNIVDFTVIESAGVPACGTVAAPIASAPGGVAIDEQRNLAVVTNTGCSQVSLLSLDPANKLGQIVGTIPTGGNPTGVAVLPRLSATLGVAVVTNNASGTVSILDLDKQMQAAKDVTVGTNPTGVAIDQQTNLAVIANTGSNSVSAIDLTPLTATPVGTLTVLGPVGLGQFQNPLAVAIDPDRGSNGRGLAVVSALQSNGASSPFGALVPIDIGGATPVVSTSAAFASFLNATPTDVVFDPAATSNSTNPGLFYAVASQSNQVAQFNPDTGSPRIIPVGINPTSLAINPNTGTLVTVNSVSNTISLVDTQTFQTKQTIGIGGNGKLAAAIHKLQNLAVIVDQANNRVLLLPLP